MSDQQPHLLPPLIEGQQIKNGPYTVTVTASMVKRRERENRELLSRWEETQRRRRRMEDPDDYYGDFKQQNVRRRFIRRVFGILSLQLLVTTAIIGSFVLIDDAREFILTDRLMWILSLIVFLFTYFAISCSDCARRNPPFNYLCLIMLTLSFSYLTAFLSVLYSVEAVLVAAGATSLIVIIIWSVATCTKFDLTKHAGFMMIFSIVALIGMLAMLIAFYFTGLKILHVGIAIIGTLMISLFLFFDVQTIMGGRMMEISPDEVIYATTQIYVDIILLYRYILMFMGLMGDN